MQTQQIEISSITVDEKIQQRANLNKDYIDELSVEINEGAVLPPLDVFDIDGDLKLADGFHRLEALIKAGVDTVAVTIIEGNEREAILHAVGANANHGLRRTNADKRCAVTTLLKDKEWGNWSDGVIARRCRVSQPFVSKIRNELTHNGFEWDPIRKGADNRLQDISNIGTTSQIKESIDSHTIKDGGSLLPEKEPTNANEKPHSLEGSDVETSSDADSEDTVDVVTTDNNNDGQSDGGVDENNSADDEDLSTEADSTLDSNVDDEPITDDESSDQTEEGDSGSDGDDADGTDESTQADSEKESTVPASCSEKQSTQVNGENPETDSDDGPPSEEATDAAGQDNSPIESEADDSQASSCDLSQIDDVQILEGKIAELETTIAEKNQRIEELEAEYAELQSLNQELTEQLIACNDSVESDKEVATSPIY